MTVIIDPAPIRDGTGSARPLDLVEGRSKKAAKTRLDGQPDDFRRWVQIVTMG